MQNEKQCLNAGFIGVGNFISGNHLPNMAASKLWKIHHVCDIDRANLERAVGTDLPLTFAATEAIK